MEIQKKPSLKIKESLGRGKAYMTKGETIKGVFYICEAIKMFLKSKLYGTEKTEIEYLIAEAVQLIKSLPDIQPFLPKGFGYTKGKIKKLYVELVDIVKALVEYAKEGKKEEEGDLKELHKRRLLDKLQKLLTKRSVNTALKMVEKYFEEFGKDDQTILEIADEFYSSKNYKEAINLAQKILEKDNKNQKAYKIILNSYMNLKEYKKVEDYYLKALEEFGEHANIFFNLFRLYQGWGKKDKALEAIKKAVELDPENDVYIKALNAFMGTTDKEA